MADQRRYAQHFAGCYPDGVDNVADGALELGRELEHRRVAFKFGSVLGLDAIGIGARQSGIRSFGFSRPLSCEQLCQLMSHPDQHAGFQDKDKRMKNYSSEICAARKDRRRNDEIEYQMMQGESKGTDKNRSKVAIGDKTGQRR